MMYHCYQTHYKMHNNINTHVHVKKNHVVYKVHYPLPLMHEKKKKPFQINGNYPFSQQYLQTQAIFFSIFKRLKRKWWYIIFWIFKLFKPWSKYIILGLRKSKLTKAHIFFKIIFNNINTNAFNIRDVHLWFANTNIQFILDPYVVATYCTSYMNKINKLITSFHH